MSIPVFDDVEPPPACGCEGCARRRLADAMGRGAGRPAAAGPARAVVSAAVSAAVAGSALCAAGPAAAAALPDDDVGLPAASAVAPRGLYGAPATAPAAAPLRLTRAQILDRAETWVAAGVPYSMTSYWQDGYRQDCSGYVSMAWGLRTNAWTGNLATYGVRITRAQLRPGDILLFHNRANPQLGSHTVIFGGWVDSAHTLYTAYEQTRPGTRVRTTPYAYWSNSSKYVPYRYKYLVSSGSSGSPADTGAYPGSTAFGPGADNADVTRLGTLLVARGAGAYYTTGPGPRWSRADQEATAAFQRAQGWTGSDADGLPGPATWRYLIRHLGRDIGDPSGTPPDRARSGSGDTDRGAGAPYPGAAAFRPGSSSDDVLALGRRLVAKGFGTNYRVGPGREWGEADRRNVEAFQRAQGWSGREADGHPGPETWRRLFS